MQHKVLVLRPNAATIGGVEHYYNVLALDTLDPRFEYFQVTHSTRESGPGVIARLVRLYYRYWCKLRSRDYGLVILNPSLNRNSFYRDAAFCILARLARCRVAVFFRGWSDDMEDHIRRRSLPRLAYILSFAQVPDIIVLSETFQTKLSNLGCRPDVRFWHASTVADDSFLTEFDIAERLWCRRPLRLLFMSRLVPAKGAAIALQAFILAQARLPERSLHLTIAGDGPELRSLTSLVESSRQAGVKLAGAVGGDAKKMLLFESDVFIFPTAHGEGMPNVVLEAMLYGMPVLSRPVGGIPDIIEHGVNGFLTERVDPAIFADWIVRLATDVELRHRMSIANNRKAVDNYTTERVRERFLGIVGQILSN